jgi:hypothetical protein
MPKIDGFQLRTYVGTAEHMRKALAEAKPVPYSNLDRTIRWIFDAIPIGVKVRVVPLWTLFAK